MSKTFSTSNGILMQSISVFEYIYKMVTIYWFIYVEQSFQLWNEINLVWMKDLTIWAWINLLVLYWKNLHLCSSGSLVCNFLVLRSSGSGIMVVLASYNSLRAFIPFLFHGIIWVVLALMLLEVMVEFCSQYTGHGIFRIGRIFTRISVLLLIINHV